MNSLRLYGAQPRAEPYLLELISGGRGAALAIGRGNLKLGKALPPVLRFPSKFTWIQTLYILPSPPKEWIGIRTMNPRPQILRFWILLGLPTFFLSQSGLLLRMDLWIHSANQFTHITKRCSEDRTPRLSIILRVPPLIHPTRDQIKF